MNNPLLDIWKAIGLEYLYAEEGSRIRTVSKVQPYSAQKQNTNTIPTAKYNKAISTPEQDIAVANNTHEYSSKNTTPKVNSTHSSAVISTAIPLLEESKWNSYFSTIFTKTARTPLLWTYYSLGVDMFSTPSLERRQAIQEILSALGLPQGTNSFLPFTAPNNNGTYTIYPKEFRAIISRWSPTVLLWFGKEGLADFLPENTVHYWSEFVFQAPVRALLLPPIDGIDAQTKHNIVSYTKEYIRHINL